MIDLQPYRLFAPWFHSDGQRGSLHSSGRSVHTLARVRSDLYAVRYTEIEDHSEIARYVYRRDAYRSAP